MKNITLYILASSLWQLSCQQPKQNEKIEYEEEVFDESISYAKIGLLNLSEYKFFQGKLSELIPSKHVLPYDLNSPLFSDYAQKKRFIYIPEGSKIDYHPTEALGFPVGTVLIKNFYYNDAQLTNSIGKILETRLLIKKPEKWVALPYIWNEAQTEAKLEITGGESTVTLLGKDPINYQIPNMAQCKGCHEKNGKIEPIGPTARQLNRMNTYNGKSSNQLIRLQELGLINNLPEKGALPKVAVWDNKATGTLDQRARAYLEINCAHCHNTGGPAKNSGLYLTSFESDPHALGIMKSPVAAGHGSGNLKHDIVPGQPEKSIMLHRMNSNEASVMMPELGRRMIHTEGVELIKEWIKTMKE